MRRLPPLNALRAFEAAARHMSFKKAADELNVTPAAVSHQVKALEGYLGCQLFRRLNNALALTAAGARYLPLLTEGFDKLAEAGTKLAGGEGPRVLTLRALPSLASKWLGPRLAQFSGGHPGIDLRIEATEKHTDFRRDGIDVAFCFGRGDDPSAAVTPLFTDRVFPVCSPALMAGSRALRTPADLGRHTLLHIDWAAMHGASPDWGAWLAAAGVSDLDTGRGPRFSLSSLAIQAAIDGQGVALGQYLFAADDLDAGRLVRPFDLSLPLASPYCIVTALAAGDDPAIAAFLAWALDEARRYQSAAGLEFEECPGAEES